VRRRQRAVQLVDLRGGLIEPWGRDAVGDVDRIHDRLVRGDAGDHRPREAERDRREQQRAHDLLQPALRGIEVGPRHEIGEPDERQAGQQPERGRSAPSQRHRAFRLVLAVRGPWSATRQGCDSGIAGPRTADRGPRSNGPVRVPAAILLIP
jgi:hypothetical protein